MSLLNSPDFPTMARIALIDDDSSVRKAVSRLLRTHGYDCCTYESGEAALDDPGLLRMDCLVVDIRLGGISGVELCQHLRAVGSQIPYVFITAQVDLDSSGWPEQLRNCPLLVKPFEENALIESIQRSLAEGVN
jgi:FixJ family two-component response regulator